MTPAFGFSVGDFISAIDLVRRISKALKETGGASTEYQLVIIELKSLENILRHLETLQPTEDNVTHINAIRGMALTCQLPLRDFMVKLEKYESTLGPFADNKSLRAMARKSKWAIVFAQEVERLRAMVAAKNISLNLLLAMNTSQSLSRIVSQSEERHSTLISKAAEHRAVLHRVRDRIALVEEKVSRAEGVSDKRLGDIENNMSRARESCDHRFDEICAKLEDAKTSVMSLRSTGEQILKCLGTFPQEMRELLQNIFRANWHMYQVLLNIQQSTSRSPTGLLESNIRFEDALGDSRELPYEYFRHWEPFEGFLRAQFKDKIGERKVLEGQYHIIDVGNSRGIVKKEHWTRSIEQGATLTMSMIMSHLTRRADTCPRPSCRGGEVKKCPVSGLLSCKKCNLKFYPKPDEPEDSSYEVDEEEEVARRQNEEDLRLYGSRPEPMDALEVNTDPELLSLPSKDNTMDFMAAFDETENLRRTENVSDNEKTSICSDERAKVSPLSAWLTKSALPSATRAWSHPLDETVGTNVDSLKEEIREVENFRSVHLASDPLTDAHATETTDTLGLELPSQIYYRNIVDRYPLLPTYLARRLAEANSNRAERLFQQRAGAVAKAKDKTEASELDKTRRTLERPGPGPVYKLSPRKDTRKKRAREPFVRSATQASRTNPSNINKITWPSYNVPSKNHSSKKPTKFDKKRANSYTRLSNIQPQYDYWNGGSPRQRTKSVGSRSSSRNSSLHGSPKFYDQKQYQNFEYFASHSKYNYSSPSLPPPPVKLGQGKLSNQRAKKLFFDCEICGENVKVDRRRQWQKHVMRDLRPYVCTVQECDRSTESFPSVNQYLSHVIKAHELQPSEQSSTRAFKRRKEESIMCIFCGVRTEAGKGDNVRGRHVARHMEEIAFTVVTKAYEKWDFYSESSSTKSSLYQQSKVVVSRRKSTARGAKAKPGSKARTPLREATDIDAIRHDIPAGYSLKNWNPEMRPILLLGSVFDANTLGKWIYDWTVSCHGLQTPMCDVAGDLWLLLIKLAGKTTRIEEKLSQAPEIDDEELLEEFLSSGERLWATLQRRLKCCEAPMLNKTDGRERLGQQSGCEFVDIMFGRDRDLETTEAFMRSVRLWILRVDANCEDLLN